MKIRKTRIMQGVTICVGLTVLGVFALNGWALDGKDDKPSVKENKDSVVVTVNDVNITRGEVDKKIGEMLGAQAGMLPPEKMSEIRNQVDKRVIENMVVEVLLKDAVKEQGITVSDKNIDDALAKIKKSAPADVDFQQYLKTKGLTEATLRKLLAQDLRIRKLLEEQFAGLTPPTDEELMTFYKENPDRFKVPESVEVRHILISVKKEDDDKVKAEKKKRAEEIRQQLIDKKGANFEEVAASVSEGPSKSKGGMLGKIVKGQTVKPFEDAAFSQKPGEIGPVVETMFGYHIIEVLKHNPETVTPFPEAKASISDYLLGQKKQNAVKAYIDGLKTKASIVYNTEKPQTKKPS